MTQKSLYDRILDARPDAKAVLEAHAAKGALASALLSLRQSKGLTQKQLAEVSGLTQAMISRAEAATGPMPELKTIRRYIDGCGGHIVLGISSGEQDADAFVGAAAGSPSLYAVAI